MSFSEGLNESLRRSIAVLFLSLSFASIYLANVSQSGLPKKTTWSGHKSGNATESVIDFTKNELLTGSPDPFFWFILPLFGVISVGLCAAINYTALTITHAITWAYSRVRAAPPRNEDGRYVLRILNDSHYSC
jgi:glycosylphosphatidylinositol deacylase